MDELQDPSKRRSLKTGLAALFSATAPTSVLTSIAAATYTRAYNPLSLDNTSPESRSFLLDFFKLPYTHHDDFMDLLKNGCQLSFCDLCELSRTIRNTEFSALNDIQVGQIFEAGSEGIFSYASCEKPHMRSLLKHPDIYDWEAHEYQDMIELFKAIADDKGIDLEDLKQQRLSDFVSQHVMGELKKITRELLERIFAHLPPDHPQALAHAGDFISDADIPTLKKHFPDLAEKMDQAVKAFEHSEQLKREQREKELSNSAEDLDVVLVEQNGSENTYEITFNERSKRVDYRIAELFGKNLPFLEGGYTFRQLKPNKFDRHTRGLEPLRKISLTTSIRVIQIYLDNLASNTVRTCDANIAILPSREI